MDREETLDDITEQNDPEARGIVRNARAWKRGKGSFFKERPKWKKQLTALRVQAKIKKRKNAIPST